MPQVFFSPPETSFDKATKSETTTNRKNYTNFPFLYQRALLFDFPRRYFEIEICKSFSSTPKISLESIFIGKLLRLNIVTKKR